MMVLAICTNRETTLYNPSSMEAALHPQRPGLARNVDWRTTLVVLFNACFASWLILAPAGITGNAVVANLAQFIGPLLALVICWVDRRPRWRGTHCWSAILLNVGVLCFAVGQCIWSAYELLWDLPLPLPSWADVCFLTAYPCLLLAILQLPARPLSAILRTRVALDGLMIMTVIATFNWYFILGPTIAQSTGSLLQKAVGLAYPLCDLVLLGSLLLLAPRIMLRRRGRAMPLLVLGLVSIVVTDTVFVWATLHGTYATGALSDVGWSLGYMLVALSARALTMTPNVNTTEPATRSEPLLVVPHQLGQPEQMWRILAPYTMLPAMGLLLLVAWKNTGDAALESGVALGVVAMIIILVLRQIFTLLENIRLYHTVRNAYAALAVEQAALAQANRRLEQLATIDPLTSLPNHRAMVAAITAECQRARRWQQSFALLFLDIDHFKAINDGYGHAVGDAALHEFAAVVRATLRSIDTVGRWGGEEFVALLPHTSADTAMALAERIRASIADQLFTTTALHVTCSVGVAVYPQDGGDRNQLIDAADQAMYASKRLGRNKVHAASLLAPPVG